MWARILHQILSTLLHIQMEGMFTNGSFATPWDHYGLFSVWLYKNIYFVIMFQCIDINSNMRVYDQHIPIKCFAIRSRPISTFSLSKFASLVTILSPINLSRKPRVYTWEEQRSLSTNTRVGAVWKSQEFFVGIWVLYNKMLFRDIKHYVWK